MGKFIPINPINTESLWRLTGSNVKFVWGEDEDKAFDYMKTSLGNVPRLSYFEVNAPTIVIADASPVALGSVLVQREKNGDPVIICFASKSLTDVERRYSQTEKESQALVWAVEKFHYYVAGLEFELITDHKPLGAIFKPTWATFYSGEQSHPKIFATKGVRISSRRTPRGIGG